MILWGLFFVRLIFFIALPFKELVLYNKESKNKQMVLFINTELKTKIMVGIVRDCWRLFSPASLLKQTHLKQVEKDCFQVTFEYIQKWRLHIFSLSCLFQWFVTLKIKKVFLKHKWNFLQTFCL